MPQVTDKQLQDLMLLSLIGYHNLSSTLDNLKGKVANNQGYPEELEVIQREIALIEDQLVGCLETIEQVTPLLNKQPKTMPKPPWHK